MAYQDSNTFEGLAPGTYTVNVKDSLGEIKTQSGIIINAAPIPTPAAPVIAFFDSGFTNHFSIDWAAVPLGDAYFVDVSQMADFSTFLGFGRGQFFHNYALGNVLLWDQSWGGTSGNHYLRLRAKNNTYNTFSLYSNTVIINIVQP